MSAQLSLTDLAAAHETTNEAVQRVYEGADPEWILMAKRAIRDVCSSKPVFTGDDIWETGLPKPREPRALGPIMRQAAKAGLCEKTGRMVPSLVPKDHRNPHYEWRSLIYEGTR